MWVDTEMYEGMDIYRQMTVDGYRIGREGYNDRWTTEMDEERDTQTDAFLDFIRLGRQMRE
jgi:hypothetical protein